MLRAKVLCHFFLPVDGVGRILVHLGTALRFGSSPLFRLGMVIPDTEN
jgi:hypothetical protein